jgi:hypothetical protein
MIFHLSGFIVSAGILYATYKPTAIKMNTKEMFIDLTGKEYVFSNRGKYTKTDVNKKQNKIEINK